MKAENRPFLFTVNIIQPQNRFPRDIMHPNYLEALNPGWGGDAGLLRASCTLRVSPLGPVWFGVSGPALAGLLAALWTPPASTALLKPLM